MNAIEVKSNLHQLIDNIQNINLLNSILEVLKNSNNQKEGELWSSLSESQKAEVLDAYNESEDEGKLIKSEFVLRKIS